MTAAQPPAPSRLARYRPQLVSVALQALGSAATLAAALWVTWRFGLAAQGEFGLARSWFDASAALLALGLPQGVLHILYRLQTPAAAVAGWIRSHLLRLLPLAAVAALATSAAAGAAPHGALALAVVISVPFSVAHLLARSLLLPTRGPVAFGLHTALPSLLVLAGVGWLALGDGSAGGTGLHWVLLVATALAALASAAASQRHLGPASTLTSTARSELWRVSRESWLQTALAAMLPAGLLSLLAALGGGGSALGAASLGLLVYQVFVAGAGYLGPMVFDRHARTGAAPEGPSSWQRPLRRLLVCGALLALPCLLTAAWWKHSSSDVEAQAWTALGLLVAAGCVALAVRLLSAVLQAGNQYRELSRQAIWRLVLGLLVAALAVRPMGAPVALALALLVIEAATLARLHAVLIRAERTMP